MRIGEHSDMTTTNLGDPSTATPASAPESGTAGETTPGPAAVLGLDTRAWPIERLVVLLAGGVTLLTLLLGRRHDPRWRLMTGFIATNLVAQATIGWCPASLFMRRLGFRRAIDRPGA
jgi:DUF2892 family protein